MGLRAASLTLALAMLLPCTAYPELSLHQRLQQALDDGLSSRSSARGVSAAVVLADGHVWTGASGVSHDAVPMRPDMLFAIGSITKNVVAALTLRLVEEGVLSLEDPVSRWLPPYDHVDGSITLRQLLNHTSGLFMFWDNQELWDELKEDRARIWTPEEVLGMIRAPDFAPGRGWRYSNTNYLLLGMIIEKATGSTLADQLRARFWKPLGLRSTFLILQEELPGPDLLAHVYGDDFVYGAGIEDITFRPRAAHESITFGSSGLFMTAEDLARWSQALFGGSVLHEESRREMLRFESFEPVANMRGYGLGVQRYPRGFASGEEAIGHGGGNIGTSSYMVYLPDQRVSVVVMINAFPDRALGRITRHLIRIVLRDLGAIGWFPYIDTPSTRRTLICVGAFLVSGLVAFLLLLLRRRRA